MNDTPIWTQSEKLGPAPRPQQNEMGRAMTALDNQAGFLATRIEDLKQRLEIVSAPSLVRGANEEQLGQDRETFDAALPAAIYGNAMKLNGAVRELDYILARLQL